jgi:hypothetical protein
MKKHPSIQCVIVALTVALPSLLAAARDEFDATDRSHWAFQRVGRPDPPPVRNPNWVRNPIDAFVLARLESLKLEPTAPADKASLLRRATLDLIGLPPTPGEVEDFLADKSPDAFRQVVDRLLNSPQYGERWARHWLDLARYAESEGFKADETRPNAWRYRDYVIQSLNNDKPYDRFLSEQIAGDELWPDDPDARIATAFNRHYPDESNARNLMQRRQEILNDITDTVGSTFIGMTYACARCHDHKYEPILQTDYYRLQAFFANTAAKDDIVLTSPAEVKRHREKLTVWEEKTREIRDEMAAIEEPKRKEIIQDYFDKYPPEIQTAILKPESERTPFEKQMAWKAKQYLDPNSHEYIADTAAVAGKLKGEQKKRWQELKSQLETFAELHPGKLPIGTGMTDIGSDSPKTFLLSRGAYEKPKEEVPPGFLQILSPGAASIARVDGAASTGRRSALARLLTDPQNPLTARVLVNRLWHYHFGRGIVATPSDLGVKGARPTHPALLDWLTSEFVREGWSLKKIHRLIMNSSTYQQASQSSVFSDPSSAGRRSGNTEHWNRATAIDPENNLLWHFPRHRLEGEVIRDSALAVAGLLNTKMGGPSIFPELPEGMVSRGGWQVTKDLSERNRRSIYVFVRRNTRYPMFETFDMPDTHEPCPRRNVTTSPLQALTMLNSKLSLEWAQGFAGRVLQAAGADRDKQIDAAFRLAYCRAPNRAELATVKSFFDRQGQIISEREQAGERLALPAKLPEGVAEADAAVLVDLCHMLINANEFVYLN